VPRFPATQSPGTSDCTGLDISPPGMIAVNSDGRTHHCKGIEILQESLICENPCLDCKSTSN
jgi:hypothetical protein